MGTSYLYDRDMAARQERLAKTPDMRLQRERLLSALALTPGERLLDIGSGNGIFVRDAAAVVGPTGEVCGVDTAESMIAMAQGLCDLPNTSFKQADATALPHADGRFDAVTCAQLLCFLGAEGVDKALREMARVLRPGGRVVLLDTDWDSLVWNCRDAARMAKVMEVYTAVYADAHVPRSLARSLAAAGFRLEEVGVHAILNLSDDPDSYSMQSVEMAKPLLAASDRLGQDEIDAWVADLRQTAARGAYLFSLNRYLFTAVKE